jgi:hypothetical protein
MDRSSSRLNTAIRGRYAHTVLEAWLLNADESKADCAGHAADGRIQVLRPSRRCHLDGNQQFFRELHRFLSALASGCLASVLSERLQILLAAFIATLESFAFIHAGVTVA